MYEYTIVDGATAQGVAEKVTALLAEGWQLAGTLAITENPSRGVWYAQALLRKIA